ncbi:MAG: hypothetical protein Q8Q60_00200 [Candidatus Chromulinivorax sp.]|nr:hypothetical protein [Candidatus Chromulinivorax sp.]
MSYLLYFNLFLRYIFMHKIFIKALAWNSSSTFMYKIALLAHQILLYSIISHTLYGLQSSLFAIIYIAIALTNFGFEETLLPFFSIFLQSKNQFMQLWSHFIWHIVIVAAMALCMYMIMMHGHGEFLHNMRMHCNKNIIFIIAIIFFVESIKKSLVAMMQLAFLNKQIAYAEISMLIAYISMVWVTFTIQGQVTLYTIFIPMAITSTLELWYVLHHVLQFYRTLPNLENRSQIALKLIFQQRIYNYINQIIKTIYSPNSLTIFFAYLLGFQQAATIKFFTNIITLCYTCISKSIGITTGATFSAMKHMPLPVIQDFFHDITRRYFQFLYILTFVLIVVLGYSYYSSIITKIMALHILLFFCISYLESISITYEQLFMSQHASKLLAIINLSGFAILCAWGYIYHYCNMNSIVFMIIFMGIKILLVKVMQFFAKNYWGVTS